MSQLAGMAMVGEVPERRVAGIYAIRNLINGKTYVGSAVSVYQRIYSHAWQLGRGTHRNRKLLAAWKKYGAAAFIAEVLEIVPSRADLVVREQFWIDSLCSAVAGYNLNAIAGNDLGKTRTVKVRRKTSETLRAYFQNPANRQKTALATSRGMQRPEVREKCRAAMRKRLADPQSRAALASVLYSAEVTERIAARLRGRAARWTPEERAAYRTKLRTHFMAMTPEQKAKNAEQLALARSAVTAEGRRLQGIAAAGRYRVVHPDGREETIVNLTQFCISHAIPYPSAINQLTGRVRTARGYIFGRVGQECP